MVVLIEITQYKNLLRPPKICNDMSRLSTVPEKGTREYLDWLKKEIVRLEEGIKEKEYIEWETRALENRLQALQSFHINPGSLAAQKQRYQDEYLKNSSLDYQHDDLHSACFGGQISEVEKCLLSGESINKHNENGLTPLHVAVQRKLKDVEAVVEFILKNKADVNAQTIIEKETALHLAIRYGRPKSVHDIVEKLMEYGADTQIRNRNLRKAYDYAIEQGLADIAELLSSDLPPSVAVSEFRKKKAVYYGERLTKAIIKGDIKTILSCIERKADVNYKNQNGDASIHLVIKQCPLEKRAVLKLLIDSGANINLQDQDYNTVLNLVIKAEELRANDLMHRITEDLIQLGIDHTQKNKDGKDAWLLAKEKGYEDILRLLRTRNNKYPAKLFYAVSWGYLHDVKEALQLHGININVRNKDGYCVMHLAVLREDEGYKSEIIELLYNNRANINARSSDMHRTALHIAAINNDVLSAKKLLDLKIDPTIEDKENLTALQLAQKHNNEEVAEVIAQATKKNKTCNIL